MSSLEIPISHFVLQDNNFLKVVNKIAWASGDGWTARSTLFLQILKAVS